MGIVYDRQPSLPMPSEVGAVVWEMFINYHGQKNLQTPELYALIRLRYPFLILYCQNPVYYFKPYLKYYP